MRAAPSSSAAASAPATSQRILAARTTDATHDPESTHQGDHVANEETLPSWPIAPPPLAAPSPCSPDAPAARARHRRRRLPIRQEAARTIEWIVPSAAGAGNDILARIIAPAMQEELGANVKVVNKEGGSQVIGLSYAGQRQARRHTHRLHQHPLDPRPLPRPVEEGRLRPRELHPDRVVRLQRRRDRRQQGQPVRDRRRAVRRRRRPARERSPSAPTPAPATTTSTCASSRTTSGSTSTSSTTTAAPTRSPPWSSGETDFALGGVSSFFGQFKSGDVNILTVVEDEPQHVPPRRSHPGRAGVRRRADDQQLRRLGPGRHPARDRRRPRGRPRRRPTEDPGRQARSSQVPATQPAWVSGSDVATLWEEREAEIKPDHRRAAAGEP